MTQFLVLAHDAADADALTRRMKAREAHLALVERNKAAGNAHFGAALLNDAGKMIGSMMVVEYPSRAALDAWLATEPYVIEKVWEKVEVSECRIAPGFAK